MGSWNRLKANSFFLIHIFSANSFQVDRIKAWMLFFIFFSSILFNLFRWLFYCEVFSFRRPFLSISPLLLCTIMCFHVGFFESIPFWNSVYKSPNHNIWFFFWSDFLTSCCCRCLFETNEELRFWIRVCASVYRVTVEFVGCETCFSAPQKRWWRRTTARSGVKSAGVMVD